MPDDRTRKTKDEPALRSDVLAKWLAPTSETRVERVAPHQIHTDLPDTVIPADLLQSVTAHGLLAPLLLRRSADGELHVLEGHKRLIAARQCGLEFVPAVVRDLDEASVFIITSWDVLNRMKVRGDEVSLARRALVTAGLDPSEAAAFVAEHSLRSARHRPVGAWLTDAIVGR